MFSVCFLEFLYLPEEREIMFWYRLICWKFVEWSESIVCNVCIFVCVCVSVCKWMCAFGPDLSFGRLWNAAARFCSIIRPRRFCHFQSISLLNTGFYDAFSCSHRSLTLNKWIWFALDQNFVSVSVWMYMYNFEVFKI